MWTIWSSVWTAVRGELNKWNMTLDVEWWHVSIKNYDAVHRTATEKRTSTSGGYGLRDPTCRPSQGGPALPGYTRPRCKMVQERIWAGFGIVCWVWVIFEGFWSMWGTACASISWYQINIKKLDFKCFRNARTLESHTSRFPGSREHIKMWLRIFPAFWKMLQTSWTKW